MARTLGLPSSLLLIELAIVLAFPGCGGSSASSSSSPHQQQVSLGSTVDGVAQAAMQQQGIPGMTVALAKNGTMLYVQAYGVSDLTTRQATAAKHYL
jgi:CubicO group peptidase (beta-lactamase class C family)